MRGELADRRREWTIPQPTLRDYEAGFAIAARRAYTAAASAAQIHLLARLAFASGEPVEGFLQSGALSARQASAMISDLKGR